MELYKIRGINEKRVSELNKLGIYDTADLVRFFPRTYLDMTSRSYLKDAYHNDMILTAGKLVGTPTVRYFRRGSGMVRAVCEQEGEVFTVVWFNQPYVASKLK